MLSIKNEVKNPSFTYDPVLLKNEPRTRRRWNCRRARTTRSAPSGWGCPRPHWGIHGTPNPSNVGHSESNGCIHLTNWDAERLSTLANAGFRVDVRP